MSESPLLEIKNVSKHFGKFRALSDVTLQVPQGRLSALIGPNGAGKTTFYNVVSGHYRPTSGRVFFQGISLEVMPGEIVCLLGRNGAGKTTTMRGIIGLNPPASGRVLFDGEEIGGRS